MRVYLLARRLRVKSSDIIDKLELLRVKAVASSKIDPDTAKKIKLLVKDTVRVEDVADELDVSVEKLLKKLNNMNIEVISHLSVLSEKDLVRLLRLKALEKIKHKTKVTKAKKHEPKLEVLKIKSKKKRVFEVAEELGVSEVALLKQLRQMNVIALHRRSPIDEELIEQLKGQHYRLIDKILYRLIHFAEEAPEIFQATSKRLAETTVFYVVIIVLLAVLAFSNVLVARSNFIKQKTWVVQGTGINQSIESYQVLETIALMEVKNQGIKFPIVEEGKDNSPITTVLVHKSATVAPGNEGSSLLEDKTGNVSKKLEGLKVNDILTVSDLEGNVYYYRVINGPKPVNAKDTTYKSLLNLSLANGRKVVAVLQKIE